MKNQIKIVVALTLFFVATIVKAQGVFWNNNADSIHNTNKGNVYIGTIGKPIYPAKLTIRPDTFYIKTWFWKNSQYNNALSVVDAYNNQALTVGFEDDLFGGGGDLEVLNINGSSIASINRFRTNLNSSSTNINSINTNINSPNVSINKNIYANSNSLGIGTNNPRFPLEIASYVSNSPMTDKDYETWFYPSGNVSGKNGVLLGYSNGNGSTGDVSIYTAGFIASNKGFSAHSDIRIKNINGVSNSAADLKTLNKIQITDYSMRDNVQDNQQYKKVIAQQVQSVFPEAVMNIGSEQYIANLYQLVDKYDVKANTIIIDLVKPIEEKDKNDIVSGAAIKFYLNEKEDRKKMKEIKGTVSELNGNKLIITTKENIDNALYDKLFVYGTKVNNLLSVDYDAIAMLNVSATQELYKMIEDLKIENERLKAENKLINSSKADAADITELKSQLLELKKQLLQIGMRTQK